MKIHWLQLFSIPVLLWVLNRSISLPPEWLVNRVSGEGEHGLVVGGVAVGVDSPIVTELDGFQNPGDLFFSPAVVGGESAGDGAVPDFNFSGNDADSFTCRPGFNPVADGSGHNEGVVAMLLVLAYLVQCAGAKEGGETLQAVFSGSFDEFFLFHPGKEPAKNSLFRGFR